jgi:hypothetical protein
MKPYDLFLAIGVIEFIEILPKAFRGPLRNTLVAIGDNPAAYADSTMYDSSGRLLHIAHFKKFLIIYWIDDPDGHVKILKIRY